MNEEALTKSFKAAPVWQQYKFAVAVRDAYVVMVRDGKAVLEPKALRDMNAGIARLRGQLGLH